jgi:hypothetical protein
VHHLDGRDAVVQRHPEVAVAREDPVVFLSAAAAPTCVASTPLFGIEKPMRPERCSFMHVSSNARTRSIVR